MKVAQKTESKTEVKKDAAELAEYYELKETNSSAFFDYIIESKINGNSGQCSSLFSEMTNESQLTFLTQYLNTEDKNQFSVLALCIKELITNKEY